MPDARVWPGAAPAALPWSSLLAVVVFAAALRALFYPGFFGSDEVTYTESAFKLLHGDWTVSSYVGANRYGVNLPVAAFGALFGQNEFAAALYSLLCSLGEVALVTYYGARMFGSRAGVLAGTLLASLPIHVHFAGRMMADAPMALAITASMLLFYDGETRGGRWRYFVAGVAAGIAFWIKPIIVFYLGVLVLYPLLFRRFRWEWGWMVAGFVVAVLVHNLLLWHLTGRFWFIIETIRERQTSGYLAEGAQAGTIADAPGFYLEYLFVKVFHTWLLGYLAVAALYAAWRVRARAAPPERFALAYTAWWAVGLILLLSLLVVSVRPLMLIPKQTNYMLIFVAPLCLLAGVALARLTGLAFAAAAAAVFLPALALALLQQMSILVFTANSKAAVDYALAHPDRELYVMANAYRAAQFRALVHPETPPARVHGLEELRADAPAAAPRYAIVDRATLGWASSDPIRRPDEVPACWVAEGELRPADLGPGARAVRATARIAAELPGGAGIAARLNGLTTPAPATVYRVPIDGCAVIAGPKPAAAR